MKVYVYESKDDTISAVVMDGNEVKRIISGLEDKDMSRSEFVAAARSRFEGAGYDSGNFSGTDIRQAAEQMGKTDRLIAEITQDTMAMHPENMCLAGHIPFEIGQFI